MCKITDAVTDLYAIHHEVPLAELGRVVMAAAVDEKLSICTIHPPDQFGSFSIQVCGETELRWYTPKKPKVGP